VGLFKKERNAVVNATEAVKDGTNAVKIGLFIIGAIAVTALVIAVMK
jgi:hypothetical protein